MLFVVLYHCCVFWNGDWFTEVTITSPSIFWKLIPTWLNSFHIWGFALVSGFIYSYLQSIGHYGSFSQLLKKKIHRLIIPYIFACIVWIIPVTQHFYHFPGSTIVSKFLLGISPSQLWFLLMLFNVFILSWITEKLFKSGSVYASMIAIMSYGIGIIGSHFIPDIFQIWNAFQYLPVFILGYKLYQDSRIPRPLPWVVFHTITFMLIYLIPGKNIAGKLMVLCLNYINHISGAVMAFAVLQWIVARIDYRNSKVYNLLSKHSMTIYLFHQQIIYFVIYNLVLLHINVIIIALINFVVALSISLLISIILSKWKVTRFLIGE